MANDVASWARELEVLVGRGVRQGRLSLDELVDVYGQLRPDAHPLIDEPRRVDLAACAAAVARLPAGLLGARRVWLVPALAPFGATPVSSPLAPAGVLGDGTLVVEVSFFPYALLNLLAPLCLLRWEASKAQRLLAAAAEAAAGDPPDVGEEAAPADEEEAALVSSVMAHLAFVWGLEPRALVSTATAADRLVELLVGEINLPELQLHAALAGAAARERGARRGAELLQGLAEMGWATRPLVLWLGDSVLTDCLSPYCRELRAVLGEWAATHAESVGEDFADGPGALDESALYAVARDFWRADPALARERDQAERTVGILRHGDGEESFELIDLGRIDAGLCDVRLAGWRPPPAPGPVVVRLSPNLGEATAETVRQILAAVGSRLIGVTVVLPGSVLGGVGGVGGALVAPHLLVRWAGEELVQLPGTSAPVAEVQALADHESRAGAVLSVPSAAWLSATHLGELVRRLGVVAVEIGGAELLRALAEARWSGVLSPDATLSWWVVHHQLTGTERPDKATLAAQAAIALASLRRLGAPEPAPPPPPAAQRPERSGRRSVRLKA